MKHGWIPELITIAVAAASGGEAAACHRMVRLAHFALPAALVPDVGKLISGMRVCFDRGEKYVEMRIVRRGVFRKNHLAGACRLFCSITMENVA